jgi:hypothetical protein
MSDRTAVGILGLRDLIVTNRLDPDARPPVNAAAYEGPDFVRDLIRRPIQGGGNPDLVIISADYLAAFSAWGWGPERAADTVSAFGFPVRPIATIFLPGVRVVPCRSLPSLTAVALTSSDVAARFRCRPLVSATDHIDDRDIDLEVSVGDEAKHAWVGALAYGTDWRALR